ncbi:MAG: hypothetical protein K9L75_01775 [Spirochaetia bacterium]|nr:hypothetical protein [Spirochaetia bacterium]
MLKGIFKGSLYLIIIITVIIGFLSVSDSEDGETKKKPMTEEEKRKVLLEQQFSAWDGSHRELTKVIKEAMHNPKTYEHIQTSYIDKGDHLIVITEYRGSNMFGAIIKDSVTAKVDLKGNILEIIDE